MVWRSNPILRTQTPIDMNSEFSKHGFMLRTNAFEGEVINQICTELLSLGNIIGRPNVFTSLNAAWNHFRSTNRSLGGRLYNGFKYLPSIKQLATSSSMTQLLQQCGVAYPALIDINCRIDSSGEEKFLFDWHQDYWFSICSTNAVVVWIPLVGLDPDIGGLDIISNEHTGRRILKTRPGDKYDSYADAVLLDEALPSVESSRVDQMNAGDALCFGFNVLHRSLPVSSSSRSRFTVQLRFADFNDEQFISNNYRPGAVSSSATDYLRK